MTAEGGTSEVTRSEEISSCGAVRSALATLWAAILEDVHIVAVFFVLKGLLSLGETFQAG